MRSHFDPTFDVDPFWMQEYQDLIRLILDTGEAVEDRTGYGTRVVSTPNILQFNARAGIPVVPWKNMACKSTVEELLWFLRGDNNPDTLPGPARKWWIDYMKSGREDLGPIYGVQWRRAPSPRGPFDQMHAVLKSLHGHIYSDRPSRRHVVSLWGVGQQDDMALPCCHGTVIQFFVRNLRTADRPILDCTMYQRSADVMLGLPVNILSYSVLLHIFSKLLNVEPGKLKIVLGDAHIYNNHVEEAERTRALCTEHRRALTRQMVQSKCHELPVPRLCMEFAVEDVWPNVEEPPDVRGLSSSSIYVVDEGGVLSKEKQMFELNV